jgi:hypothetical protein
LLLLFALSLLQTGGETEIFLPGITKGPGVSRALAKLVPLVLGVPVDVALDLVVGLVVRAVPVRDRVALDFGLVARLVVRAVPVRDRVALDLGLLVLALLLRHCSSFRKLYAPLLALSTL